MKRVRSLARFVILYLALSLLKPDPNNPRRHSDQQIKKIARSIETFGFVVPILVDQNNVIVAGHGRYLAAQILKMAEVPVISLEHLNEAKIKALRIADNRLTEISEWNDELLAETLKDLSNSELDFSLDVTGFSMPEIDFRIEGIAASHTPDPVDNIPEITESVAISKVGDLWQLGRHYILCGDALAPDSYSRLMDGKLAAMVFSDPPYNQKISGHVSGKGKVRHREFVMATGEMTRDEFADFLVDGCKLMAANSVDGAIHFICMDWPHAGDLLSAGQSAYSQLKYICVWVKNNGGMGSLYRSRHEFIFVFKNGTAPHHNNIELGRHGRNRTNVWEYSGANGFGRQSDEGDLSVLHPTVKPVRMIADAMLDCSGRDDIVLDPFLGSGSTLIAAERVGRTCRGIELDPIYVDVAIRRWQAYTGDSAIKTGTDKRFNELAAKVDHG
jgi:DNA modification methylase